MDGRNKASKEKDIPSSAMVDAATCSSLLAAEDNGRATEQQLETKSVGGISEITDDHTTIVSDSSCSTSTTLAENMRHQDRWGEDGTAPGTTRAASSPSTMIPQVERAPRGKAQLEAMEYRLSCVADSVDSKKDTVKKEGATTVMTRAPSPTSRQTLQDLEAKVTTGSHFGGRSSSHSNESSQPGAFYAERLVKPQQQQREEEATLQENCHVRQALQRLEGKARGLPPPGIQTSTNEPSMVQDTSRSEPKNEQQAVVSESEPSCKQQEEQEADTTMVPIRNALLVAEPPDEFKNTQICMAACDGGGGWAACRHLCLEDATFTCQSDTMGQFTTIREYADFMAGFGRSCPNPTWTTDQESWDGVTHTATFFCTYYCQHTVSVEGYGPEVPTMKRAVSHYCCKVTTDPARGNKVVNITKVWNDIWMLRELGWLAEATPEASSENGKGVERMEQVDDDTSASTAPDSPESAREGKRTWKKNLAKFLSFGKHSTSR